MTITKNKILALFPGQGSQYPGMGKDLFDKFELARRLFTQADGTLNFSLSDICFNGPVEKLTLTEIAQPAILAVSVICFELAKELYGDNLNIVAAAGHSLGEYSALVASGALKFEDAISLVHKRGRYMQEAVAPGAGKMVAILGKELGAIEDAVQAFKGEEVLEVANINAPGQIVVAGSASGVNELIKKFEGAKLVELSVSAPFHCSLMKPAEEKLCQELDRIEFGNPAFPVYANYNALPLLRGEQIRNALKSQVCSRVLWTDSMQRAIAEYSPDMAMEFGAGNVLSNLLKRINKEIPRKSLGDSGGFDAISASQA
jgi:[acyl-carrier-protein] S-malonyltransferase